MQDSLADFLHQAKHYDEPGTQPVDTHGQTIQLKEFGGDGRAALQTADKQITSSQDSTHHRYNLMASKGSAATPEPLFQNANVTGAINAKRKQAEQEQKKHINFKSDMNMMLT